MRYIVCKKFNKKGIAKNFNLAKGSVCNEVNGIIYYNEEPICYTTSDNAYNYFSRDDDGHGLERFALISEILGNLSKLVKDYGDATSKVKALYLDHELSEQEQEEMQQALANVYDGAKEFYDKVRLNPALRHLLKSDCDVFNKYFYNADLTVLENVLGLFDD